MFYVTAKDADELLEEDLSYFDMTTFLLGIEEIKGKIEFYSREECIVSGAEEVKKIFQNLGIKIVKECKSGDKIEKGALFFAGEGESDTLHKAWKVSLNIFEYASGIATRTWKMKEKARSSNNKRVSIGTTRKVFPGTKKLALKSVVAGGGMPHRQSLSDSILIFKQHLEFFKDFKDAEKAINSVKEKTPEKKVLIEADNCIEAVRYSEMNIDGIQIDKADAAELKECIEKIKKKKPNIIILAAGGINESNAKEYAESGADVLVTTSVYFGKPVDMGVRITKA